MPYIPNHIIKSLIKTPDVSDSNENVNFKESSSKYTQNGGGPSKAVIKESAEVILKGTKHLVEKNSGPLLVAAGSAVIGGIYHYSGQVRAANINAEAQKAEKASKNILKAERLRRENILLEKEIAGKKDKNCTIS